MPQRRGKGAKVAGMADGNNHYEANAMLADADSTEDTEKYNDHNSNHLDGVLKTSKYKDEKPFGRNIALTDDSNKHKACASSSSRSTSSKRHNSEDSNGRLLMRQWIEDQANAGTMAGLQWIDPARKWVKINWKHASKSGWTKDDCEVFVSWAKHTGISSDTS
jgi:Interferon regulatory factor transcription factor